MSKKFSENNIEPYEHKNKSRPNNPQVGMVTANDSQEIQRKKYSYDPHLDPALVWSGKKENQEISVDTINIHVHERIDPKTIISNIQRRGMNNEQPSLFDKENQRPLREEMNFYQHQNAWANRLISGDSLLIMNSLLEKEGLTNSVQMIYIDPPYGIKYRSNFQPYTNKKNMSNSDIDSEFTIEPEMVKAFRDTWELGIHSYLSYIRDRLLLARKLLKDTGSLFIQISDKNLHYIRELGDEIFGSDNFVNIIIISKNVGVLKATKKLTTRFDYLIWYAKDIDKLKYHTLYEPRKDDIKAGFNKVMLKDGNYRSLTKEEIEGKISIPTGSELFKLNDIYRPQNPSYDVWLGGKQYTGNWIYGKETMNKLIKMGRIKNFGNKLYGVLYLKDSPYKFLDNLWDGFSGAKDPMYVVQTNHEIIKRCILMTTDPGDLVLDPTCGFGTTAYTAEQWGRRWVTIDTSRIAIQIARQRLITSSFDWYELAFDNEGVGSGFLYEKIPNMSLGDLAKGDKKEEVLYDKPFKNNNITRVCGPFTVEAIPTAVTMKSLNEIPKSTTIDKSIIREGETARQDEWRNELLKTPIHSKTGGGGFNIC